MCKTKYININKYIYIKKYTYTFIYKNIITSKKPTLPSYIKSFGAPIQHVNNDHLKKVAWMEIKLFEPQKYNQNQKELSLNQKQSLFYFP